MRSPNPSCVQGPAGRIWMTSRMAKHMSQCHCYTKFAGYDQPPSRWAYTTWSHSCSYQWYQLRSPVTKQHPKIHTFLPNWFAVLSMQMMRFLPFIPWEHGLGCPSERCEWLVGTNSRSDVWPLIEKILGCSSKGGLYSPPPFSSWTPVGLCQTWPIQNAKFLALELL